MRIAVVGAGAVGGYFGGRLAEAGEEVVFLARGATLAALRESGLILEDAAGSRTLHPVAATADPASVGPVVAVVFATKAWQVEEAARAALPLFGADTFAVPLLNGIEVPDRIAAVVGRERTLGGLCRIVAEAVAPGRIRHHAFEPTVTFGELDDRPSERSQRLRRVFSAAGVKAQIPESIHAAIWGKALFIVPTSAVGAIARATVGEMRAQPETRRLIEEATAEIDVLARARGVPLTDDAVERTMAFLDSLDPSATSSMQRDIEAGRPSELDAQCGAVLRLARETGVETPVVRMLHAALLPAELRARGGGRSGPPRAAG